MSNDSEIETFLRRFKPRAPTPLPTPTRSPARTWRFLAVAAAFATAIVLFAWRLAVSPGQFSSRAPAAAQRVQPTLGALNAALRAGNLEALATGGALPGRPEGGLKWK
jgi:hypothetical protein